MWAETLSGYWNQLMQDVFFKSIASTIGAVVAGMFGGVAALVTVLFLLLCCDFLLGFWRAWRRHCVSARKARAGVMKMFFYAIAVFVMAAVEHAVRNCGAPLPVRDVFLAFLCVNEALSCLDHLAFFGVPVPARIRERLRSYREKILGE